MCQPTHMPAKSTHSTAPFIHLPLYVDHQIDKKKSLIASSNTVYLNEMPSAFYVRLFVSWPSFFHDCLCVFDCVCAYVPK